MALARGDLKSAEDALRTAVNLDEDFAYGWSNLGVVLEKQGRFSAARQAFEQALSIDPGVVEARRNLIALLIGRGHDQEARAHLLRLLQLTPDTTLEKALAACEARLCGKRRTCNQNIKDV